ncbi:MAG: calcium/sodium antiporter [Candidatus Sumerlaeota bacterium]|nr:calcium/sodium antiporter [Candidatus Sumerlaeota bacterium]
MAWLAVQFIIGVLLLNKSADWFVRGASRLAELLGLPRLVIGVVLVGFATELPEFAVSIAASWAGHSEIALGNAIGSNSCNTGLILGLCLVCLNARFETVWLRDYGIPMLLSCAVMYLLAIFWDVSRFMGFLYLLLCAAYFAWMAALAKREPVLARSAEEWADEVEGSKNIHREWYVVGLLFVISLPIIWLSSKWLLASSIQLAQLLGISESVIALTLVSVGTSLPELATSWAASRRGHYDTSVGLIMGSIVYNAFGVIGCSGVIHLQPYTAAHRLYDIPVMILIQIILLAPVLWNRSPGRKTGYALLIVYGLYVYSLFTLYGIFS